MAHPDAFVQLRRTNLTWREVDGVIIALDLSSSTYFTTNKTGKVLWNAMIDGAEIVDLIRLLQTTFALAHEVAATDVRAFLKLLDANDLLRQGVESSRPQARTEGSSA